MGRLLLILFCLAASLEAVGLRVAPYNVGARNIEGNFIHGIGDPGQVDHDEVLKILSRIDADVVALQEIHFADISGAPDDLDALAAALGLPHVYVATGSGAIDFQFRVAILSRFPFLESEVIRSPAGAMEVSRLSPAVKVDIPGTDSDPWIISSHLKSGSGSVDRFRKAIEMRRIGEFFEAEGIADDEPFVILGDFNPSGTDRDFTSEDFAGYADDLPNSYALGSDVTFPVSYTKDPSPYFPTVNPVLLDPRQLDEMSSSATFYSGSLLDLMLVSPELASRPIGTEIYNSEWDDANDTGLPKSGSPLDDGVSEFASDHYALFADIELDEPDPYFLTQSGDSVTEDFDGFDGLFDPVPWSSVEADWMGLDDGSLASAGGRSYGDGSERAPGFVVRSGEQVLEAEFVNLAEETLTILDVSYLAEQWRASFGGNPDRIEVDLVEGAAAMRLEALDFGARTDLPTGLIPGGSPALRALRVSGLSIERDQSFRLRFRFLPGDEGGDLPTDVFVNEIHYDNSSSDEGEFVEVVVGPGYDGALEDVVVILYNGVGGSVTSSHSLDTFNPGITTDSGHRIFWKPISGIQNGSPDGFALVVGEEVTGFLSYEGSFLATEGPASGMTSTDIGVEQGSGDPAGMNALGLSGSGGESADFTWTKFVGISHSPGDSNEGQAFIVPGLSPQGLAIDDLVVTFVPDFDGDGLADDEDTDDDNDGQSDEFELAFGTDPLDGGERFTTTMNSGIGGPELRFPGAEGVSYTVEWCDDLISWDQSSVVEGAGGEIVFPLPQEGPRLFVRVRAGE